jgi:hypothetical protein
MPAKSKAQQRLMAMAEHNPSAVSAKNKGVLKMSQQQLHDFASTKRTGLPKKVKKEKPDVEAHAYDFRQHLGGRRKKTRSSY